MRNFFSFQWIFTGGKHFTASEIKHLFKASAAMCQKLPTTTDKKKFDMP